MSMRKILALLLAVVMICSLFLSPALAAEDEGIVAISDTVAPQFTDVDGHWAESAINRWAEAGIIEGDGDGTVNPGRNLKRAELATILTRLLGLKERAAADTFSDVAADAWYVDAVLKCAKAGIMQGDGTGKANPESPIDRQQAIVMIGRAVGVKPATGSSLNRFDDGATVANWAEPYMIALTDMGILNGLPTGEGDGAIIAPTVNIDRASTFALLDKAIAQYITAPCTVTVDDANKFVVINSAAEEAGEVTVTGTTAGVVVAVGTTDNVVLKNADVGTVKVDAPVDVTVSKGSSVDELDANAAAKINNKGTVTNLNTNADDVVFDGNKPAEVNTAEGVEPAKDSKGNEVTNAPTTGGSTGGSGSSNTTYKYNVSIPTTVGGKVTADVTRTNTADTEVTLTVTPNAQTATSLPYVLKSLTVKNGETEVDVTNNKFTMADEGTYTVAAEFVQPITKAVMYVANGTDKTAADMEADGYTPAGDVTDETLKNYPYFFLAMTKSEGDYTVSDMKLTANGADVALPTGWGAARVWKFASAYVGNAVPEIDPNGENADKLNFTGSAAAFVLTFKIDTAEYEFSCDYVKPGVDASTLHTVTFKTSTGTEIVSYKAAESEQVTAPAAPAIDGYYFAGWDTELTDNQFTVGETDAVVTAKYVKIGDQELKTRPNGPANNGETDFDYAAAYEAAGVKLTGTAGNYTYTIDAATFLNYAATPENKLPVLAAEVDGTTYYFYGAAIMAPAGATKLVLTKNNALTSLDDATKRTEFDLETSEHSFTIGDQKCILNYFGAVAEKDAQGVYGFQPDGVFVRYAKWVDSEGNIIAVNKIVLNRKTTPAKLNVTFKADGKTVETKTVDYNAAIGELPAVPAKVGYTGAWKGVNAETKITADTEVVAEYTAIEYTIYYDGVAESATMNVESETNHTLKDAPADDAAHEGYHFTGWQILTACGKDDEGAVEDENDAGKYYKWVDFSGEIAPADLPAKAVGKDANCIHFQSVWAPNYEVSFETMSAEVYDLYKGDREFGVNIPELDKFQTTMTFEAGEKAGSIVVKGELLPITDPAYAGFNGSNPKEQTGYYLLFQFEAPKGTKDGNVSGNIVITDKKSFTTAALDKVGEKEIFSFIWWLAEPTSAANATLEGKTINLTIDWDGNGEKIGTKYTLDLSGVTLKATESATPGEGDETASLSAVETEDVAAPAPVASHKEDDEIPEIPVLD